MGVQSSFLWGYLLSPIAGGALADRYGGKSVMAWGVALWSLATLLTPWASRQSVPVLLAARVLMGLAEGVAMPCMNNMISKCDCSLCSHLISTQSVNNLEHSISSSPSPSRFSEIRSRCSLM